MSTKLPINLADLLRQRTVEGERMSTRPGGIPTRSFPPCAPLPMASKTLVAVVMAANGSPVPLFESDDDRLAFVIRLPCHPLVVGEMTPTGQVTGEVQRFLGALVGEMSRQQLLDT